MKIIQLALIIILMIPIALALDECQSIETAGKQCEIITPVIECSTYDLYNTTKGLEINDGSMTQIDSTGMYNFTFNQTTEGMWTILLCSNHTTYITIKSNSIWDNQNKYSSNSTWIGDSVWLYSGKKEVDISNVTLDINATISVNNTAIAKEVWDYNLTSYSEIRNGIAGSLMRFIALTVEWIERLL